MNLLKIYDSVIKIFFGFLILYVLSYKLFLNINPSIEMALLIRSITIIIINLLYFIIFYILFMHNEKPIIYLPLLIFPVVSWGIYAGSDIIKIFSQSVFLILLLYFYFLTIKALKKETFKGLFTFIFIAFLMNFLINLLNDLHIVLHFISYNRIIYFLSDKALSFYLLSSFFILIEIIYLFKDHKIKLSNMILGLSFIILFFGTFIYFYIVKKDVIFFLINNLAIKKDFLIYYLIFHGFYLFYILYNIIETEKIQIDYVLFLIFTISLNNYNIFYYHIALLIFISPFFHQKYNTYHQEYLKKIESQ